MTNLNSVVEIELTEMEVAYAVFATEQEAGLHAGLAFEQWFAAKTEVEQTEEEMMKEWANSNETSFVATATTSEKIKTSKGRKAKVVTNESVVNDLSALNGLGGKFQIGAVMRLQHFLRNAKLGTVTNYSLRVGNKGDLVGEVYGTDGSVSLTQHVYLTPKGHQAWRMKVSQF